MTFFALTGLYVAKMSLLVAQAATKVARAVWGNGVDEGWQQMGLLGRTAYLMGLSGRLVVTKMALTAAEMATDFARWLMGMDTEDDLRGPDGKAK